MALSSLTVIPEADAVLGRAPDVQLNSLRPIARITADPTVLAVRADAPWKTAKDFVEDAKKRPGAINYGSSGNYGTMHVPMEILAAERRHQADPCAVHRRRPGRGGAAGRPDRCGVAPARPRSCST